MAPKSTVSRSKQLSKEKEVVNEPLISSSSEEDPEEEQELEKETPKTMETKSSSVPLNGFVSDSGSDYDSDNSNFGYKVQAITKPPIISHAKRQSGLSDGNPSKKLKGTPSSKNSGNGSFVSRIWNKDDEIIVLREMYDFKKSKGGVDLNLDTSAFYDSVKEKLHGEYSKEQLRSKIKHMRTKYLGIVKKGGDIGFANSHEALVFDLSKKAWGDVVKGKKIVNSSVDNVVRETDGKENGVDGKKDGVLMVDEKEKEKENKEKEKEKEKEKKEKEKEKKEKKEKEKEKKEKKEKEKEKKEKEKEEVEERIEPMIYYRFLRESIDVSFKCQQALGLSDAAIKIMKDNLHLIGKGNASELDEEWKELLMEEVELNLKKASLMKKQIELVFDCIKKP